MLLLTLMSQVVAAGFVSCPSEPPMGDSLAVIGSESVNSMPDCQMQAESGVDGSVSECSQCGDCCPGICAVMAFTTVDAFEFYPPPSFSFLYGLQLTQRSDSLFRPPIIR